MGALDLLQKMKEQRNWCFFSCENAECTRAAEKKENVKCVSHVFVAEISQQKKVEIAQV